MMSESDDFFREGERLALDWIAGKSELLDDFAALVVGMKEFGEMERAFLLTIGNEVRAAAKREGQPTFVVASDPAPKPQSAPAAEPKVDIDAFRRRQRAHEQAARLEELARRNANAFVEMHHAFAPNRPKGADWS
jgi:hypothetical protein